MTQHADQLLAAFAHFFPGAATIGSYIDGELVAGQGDPIQLYDAATGQATLAYRDAGAAVIDHAAESARRAQREWWALTHAARGRVMQEVARAIRAEAEAIARLEALGSGKPIRDCRGEVARVAEMFEYYAGWTDKFYGSVIPVPSSHLNYTRREPAGVVLQITPWNAPVFTCGWQVAPAVAMGNGVLLKPSELTPFTSLAVAMLGERAGLPRGLVNVLAGFGHTAGQAAIAHRVVSKVVFVGSPATGARIAEAAARRVLPCVLELGGKSANIVFADADLKRAALTAQAAIFAGAGQSCVAGSRLLVQRAVYDEFVAMVAAGARKIRVGAPLDDATEVGPINNRKQYEHVMSMIERGVAAGDAAQPFHEARAELLGAIGNVVALDDPDRRGAGHHADLVAAEGAGVHARLPGVERLVVDHHRERVAAAEHLREHDRVGDDAGVVDREHLAGAAQARLHLVDDQRHVVLDGQLAQRAQPFHRGGDAAALALHGLDDDRGGLGDAAFRIGQHVVDVVDRQRVGRRAVGAERAAEAIRIGQEMHARGGHAGRALGIEVAHRGQRAGRHAVVGAMEGHDAGAAGMVPGELDGGFHRVRAARSAELDLARFAHADRQLRDQRLDEGELGRRGEIEGLLQLLRIEVLQHRFLDLGMVVTQAERAGVRQAIEVGLPVGVVDAGSLRAHEHLAEGVGVGSRVRFHALQIVESVHVRLDARREEGWKPAHRGAGGMQDGSCSFCLAIRASALASVCTRNEGHRSRVPWQPGTRPPRGLGAGFAVTVCHDRRFAASMVQCLARPVALGPGEQA